MNPEIQEMMKMFQQQQAPEFDPELKKTLQSDYIKKAWLAYCISYLGENELAIQRRLEEIVDLMITDTYLIAEIEEPIRALFDSDEYKIRRATNALFELRGAVFSNEHFSTEKGLRETNHEEHAKMINQVMDEIIKRAEDAGTHVRLFSATEVARVIDSSMRQIGLCYLAGVFQARADVLDKLEEIMDLFMDEKRTVGDQLNTVSEAIFGQSFNDLDSAEKVCFVQSIFRTLADLFKFAETYTGYTENFEKAYKEDWESLDLLNEYSKRVKEAVIKESEKQAADEAEELEF